MRLTSSTAELRPKHLRECHVRQQHSVPLQLQTVALGLLGVQRQWHSVTLYLAALGLEGGVSERRRLIPSADEAQRGRSRAHAEWSLRSVDTNPNCCNQSAGETERRSATARSRRCVAGNGGADCCNQSAGVAWAHRARRVRATKRDAEWAHDYVKPETSNRCDARASSRNLAKAGIFRPASPRQHS